MASKNFDDIIKGKLKDYSDPQFDESALAGLHDRMATQAVSPWYVQNQTLLGVGAMLVVFTLLNFWINQTQNDQKYADLLEQMRIIQKDVVAAQSSKDSQSPPASRAADTIYIIREISIPSQGQLVASTNPGTSAGLNRSAYHPDYNQEANGPLFVGNKDNLSPEAIEFLGGHFILIGDNEGGLYLIPMEKPASLPGRSAWTLAGDPANGADFNRLTFPESTSPKEKKGTGISAQTSRELDKHYHQGVGLRAGGQFDLFLTVPETGVGPIKPGGGFVGELMFSPSLSLESGIKVQNRTYGINHPDSLEHNFPDVNSALGELVRLESDSWVVEIPINLKYYHPLTSKSDLLLALGVSPNLYTSQMLEYEYLANFDGLPIDDLIIGEKEYYGAKFYPGTINAGVGISLDLPKRRTVQLGLYYQKSFGGMGVEDQPIQIVGLNSSYWFRLR